MNYMCYYTRNDMIIFSIKFEKSGNELNGSDRKEELHRIIEHYDVKTIERVD